MNFFGDFRVNAGRVATWASTANYIQKAGYYFKDAFYLVDDYKPELVVQGQVIRILQNYTDRTGRGRLRQDTSSNTTRPIRGLLVSTGEDIPEHSASAIARSIIIEVPTKQKDIGRGRRCISECHQYSGVTADLIRHLIAKNRMVPFRKLFQSLQSKFTALISGVQNDTRIANDFALLAAGFAEVARYFRDVWPDCGEQTKCFYVDLTKFDQERDSMTN